MATVLGMEHEYGIVYPENGMISLAKAYAAALNKHNGRLLLNSKIVRILIEDGVCRGVELQKWNENIF